MRVCQGETGGRVVKIRRLPRNGIVTSRTGRHRKYCGRRGMLWIRRLLPRGQMASGVAAVRRCDLQVEVVAYMAI